MKAFLAKIGIGLTCLCFLVNCGGCDESTGEVTYEENEQPSSSYREGSNISFSDEQDVRMFLQNHRFSSNDGYTLSFGSYANEVSLNGQVVYTSIAIRSISSSSAVIRLQGPYSNTTIRLSVSGSGGVIEDTNDGTCYYSK